VVQIDKLHTSLVGFVWEFGREGRILEKRKERVEEIDKLRTSLLMKRNLRYYSKMPNNYSRKL